jgi:hypothetical protein
VLLKRSHPHPHQASLTYLSGACCTRVLQSMSAPRVGKYHPDRHYISLSRYWHCQLDSLLLLIGQGSECQSRVHSFPCLSLSFTLPVLICSRYCNHDTSAMFCVHYMRNEPRAKALGILHFCHYPEKLSTGISVGKGWAYKGWIKLGSTNRK